MTVESVLARTPELQVLLADLEHTVMTHPAMPADVLARCRARVAHLFGLGPAPAVRPGDAATDACLAYAEQLVLDVHGVTDDHAAAVTAAVGPEGLVVLTTALALWEATMRIERTLG